MPLRALGRWLAFLALVHGRGPQVLQRRHPPVFGDQRQFFPNHYPAPRHGAETGDFQ
jgi:hypothetical protein